MKSGGTLRNVYIMGRNLLKISSIRSNKINNKNLYCFYQATMSFQYGGWGVCSTCVTSQVRSLFHFPFSLHRTTTSTNDDVLSISALFLSAPFQVSIDTSIFKTCRHLH